MSLKGKKALLCGASKGIGLAAAKQLAELGAELVLVARDEASLKKIVADLPGRHHVWAQDLADTTSLQNNLNLLLKEHGDFAVLLNNTGGPKAGPLLAADVTELTAAFQSHVVPAHLLTQGLVPGMKRLKYGRILNVLSTSVKTPLPNLGVSNTIRAAMANWAKTMSLELASFGITVNNILPGYTSTDRLDALKTATAQRENKSVQAIESTWLNSIPAGRFGEPSELGAAIAFLASPAAAYINGINLPVDGGRTGSL
ncbi:MAG: SDR family oxidoreductase [Bdellovibrionales bacterium]